MPYKDKQRQKEYKAAYNKGHYLRNSKAIRIRLSKNRKKTLEWFKAFKQNLKCSLCPESVSICLDFHHRNPNEKKCEVAVLVREGHSKPRIIREIAKCDVLCANCHRKRHAGLI